MKDHDEFTDKLGMWIFLGTELCFLSGLFVAFFVFRREATTAFQLGTEKMNLLAGTINTAILLTSSLCIVLSDWAYVRAKYKLSLTLILSTIMLGLSFLALKFFEYIQHVQEHLLPGFDFQFRGEEHQRVKMFFTLYFLMTGIHALHLIIGILVMCFIALRVYKKAYGQHWPRGLVLAALYWHFVDVVWIFLFPLLYLVDRK